MNMWVEVCTDSEEDWDEALRLFAESFKESAPFVIEDRSEEDKIRFNYEYFRYIYETEWSNERSGLICVKERDKDGSIAIVYASILAHRMELSPGNRSAMDAIDPKTTDRHIEEDGWTKREIFGRMEQASKDSGISMIYGAYTACRVDRMASGMGRKFADKLIDIYHNDALRRGYFDKEKPCVLYAIVDDPQALKFQRGENNIQIAHIHSMGVSECALENSSSQDTNCVYVFAKVVSGNMDVKKTLAPYFDDVV